MDKEFIMFLKDAYANGLCEEYRDEIRRCHEDKLQLMRLAVRRQSIPWVATKLKNGVITKEYVVREFGQYLNGYVLKDCDDVDDYTYSWYMGFEGCLNVKTDVCHISHTTDTTVVIAPTKCPVVYISNGSNVHLVCDGYNSVSIYLFDDSEVIIDDCGEECDVVVYRYSKDADVKYGRFCFSQDIIVHDKELRL